MTELTDNGLMLLVRAGDIEKMGILFKRHSLRLYGFFFHMTQNKEASEDLVQEVFYRLLKYRSSFRGDGPFVTWMFFVARNELKAKMKKLFKPVASCDLGLVDEPPDEGRSVDERLRIKQEQILLHKAMAMLRHEDRELLTLSKFQGMKYAEIATLLGITEAAVKVRVHRAFNELKTMYHKNEA